MPPVTFSSTPNPNALRCDVPGARWPVPTSQGPVQPQPLPQPQPTPLRSYRTAQTALAAGDQFAHDLLMIPGLCGVLIHDGWFTVSKAPEAKWPPIKRAVTAIVLAAAQGGQP